MLRISDAVEVSVKSKPFLETALKQNIINISALARILKPEIEELTKKPVKTGAIVMALNRLTPILKVRDMNAVKITSQIRDITVKSNLVEYTFANSESIKTKLKQFLGLADNSRDLFLTLTQGVREMSVIVSVDLENELLEAFKQEEVKLKINDISAIIISLPMENVETPGVYYQILKQLAWNNINLVDAVSTANEITIFFHDDDIERAFSALKKLQN